MLCVLAKLCLYIFIKKKKLGRICHRKKSPRLISVQGLNTSIKYPFFDGHIRKTSSARAKVEIIMYSF